MPATPELVIFDCDGVLVDSELLANQVLAEAVTAQGLPMTAEESIRSFTGMSMPACYARIEQLLGRPLPPTFPDDLDRATFATFRHHLRPIPGVVQVLDHLGVPACVATSGGPAKFRFTLGITGLGDRFEGRIFHVSQVERGKPAPDLFLFAAREMRADPAHCVVVEDSLPGIAAGQAAGMRVLAFTGGSHVSPEHAARLAATGVETFDDMLDLPGLLER